MNEAIAELRAEGLQVAGLGAAEQDVVEQMHYVDDAHIEIEVEAGLPDAYVAQQAERLKLYRELDSTKDEAALQAFESRLADRFGPCRAMRRNCSTSCACAGRRSASASSG